jgi:hypothetical protein
MKILDRILEEYPEEEFLKADGFDDAIIGVEYNSMKLIYSTDLMHKILVDRDGMSDDDAIEFLEFNVFGAYVGEKTPIYCREFKD